MWNGVHLRNVKIGLKQALFQMDKVHGVLQPISVLTFIVVVHSTSIGVFENVIRLS